MPEKIFITNFHSFICTSGYQTSNKMYSKIPSQMAQFYFSLLVLYLTSSALNLFIKTMVNSFLLGFEYQAASQFLLQKVLLCNDVVIITDLCTDIEPLFQMSI